MAEKTFEQSLARLEEIVRQLTLADRANKLGGGAGADGEDDED